MPQDDNQAPKRAGVYIDGFNLYHSIKDLGDNFLKWNCIWELSENISRGGGFDLVRAVFCTAFPTHMPQATRDRFRTYTSALKARGVLVVEGHYLEERTTGDWKEKQSDVNLALSVITDAQDDLIDVAYLLTGDSDQAATARVFRERFPGKKLFPVAPPGKPIPSKTQSFSEKGFALKYSDIERCVMDGFVPGKTGKLIRRPEEYRPPEGWVHPKNRP